MSLATENSEGANAGGFFVNFNQDCTSLVAGTKKGYHLFSLSSDDGPEEIYASHSGLDTCLVDRLFSSSLVAIVTLSAPRKLIVCHFKKGTEICNYSYSNTILAVKLNRARLIVCLEESLYIHNIRDMAVLHTIRDTPPNPRGICTLSPSCNVDNCFVAYPGSSTIGEVQIFDAIHLHAKTVIPAHDSPLAAIAFNTTGTRVATASERGTVIRVFSVHDRARLYEFRRGVKRCVTISSLAFSSCGVYLCCSSNTETVHVFKLVDPTTQNRGWCEEGSSAGAGTEETSGGGWMGWVAAAVSAGAGYLPALTQGRAFAAARLPVSGVRSVCAITTIQKSLRLLVATSEGVLYLYSMDATEGGDCTLLRQHHFLTAATAQDTHDPATLHNDKGVSNSYAGALRGRDPAHMSGTDENCLARAYSRNIVAGGRTVNASQTILAYVYSEKFQEMISAVETPPKGFNLDDDKEFPPVTHGSD